MLHSTSLLLLLGLASPASPAPRAAVSVRAEARVVAGERAVTLATRAAAEPGVPRPGGDLLEATRSGAPDAWARAALFVLAAPVQVDFGPNRVGVAVRVPIP